MEMKENPILHLHKGHVYVQEVRGWRMGGRLLRTTVCVGSGCSGMIMMYEGTKQHENVEGALMSMDKMLPSFPTVIEGYWYMNDLLDVGVITGSREIKS